MDNKKRVNKRSGAKLDCVSIASRRDTNNWRRVQIRGESIHERESKRDITRVHKRRKHEM